MESIKHLKLGKMTGQEIAEWMNVKYSTYSNNPKKYIIRLNDFCNYEIIRGGAIIKEIYQDYYEPDVQQKYDKIYLQALVEHNNLITISGTAEEHDVSRYHLTKTRNRLFGDKPINKDKMAQGILGSREQIWAIKLEGINSYRYMTKEEEQLFDALIKKIYGTLEVDKIKAVQLLEDECAKRNMSVSEYQKIKSQKGLDFFNEVIKKFKELTNYQIVNTCKHTPMQFFDENDEHQKYRDKLLHLIEQYENEK